MTIVRWEPLRELGTLQSEMNRLFSTVFDGPTPSGNTMRRWMPAMDLLESGDVRGAREEIEAFARGAEASPLAR